MQRGCAGADGGGKVAGLEEVRSLVVSAFQSVPVPKPNKLMMRLSPYTDNAPDRKAVRAALEGKHWTELTPTFCKDHPVLFPYLTAEAYQHYLPALLTSALDCFNNEPHLANTAVYAVKPSEHAIYYRGNDDYFDRQIALLTREQHEAVAAFLGIWLDREPYYFTFIAARAFRWGWDKVETREHPRFRAFYERLHHWQHTRPSNTEMRRLLDEIESAFADTPYPGDNSLCGSDQGDEPAESALDFRGVHWQNVHPELLAANYTSLSFLTAEGFRYYLPAYLAAELSGCASESGAFQN
jgi:hypothetical protein